MNKKLTTGLVAAMLLAGPFVMPTMANAESVQNLERLKQELNTKSNDLDSKIKNQENKLTSLESKKAELENDVTKLQTNIDEVIIKLHEQEKKLKKSKENIEKLQKEIEALKELIAQREEKLQNQARVIQTDGRSSNMVEMVVTAESLSDLIGRVGIINQLVTANKEIVTAQENDKITLEVNEKKAEVEKVAIEKLKSGIEVAKNNLVAQKAEMDDNIVQLAVQYNLTESEKDTFINEQKIVATKTSVLSEELQQEKTRIFEVEQARQVEIASKQAAARESAKKEEQRSVASSSSNTQAPQVPQAPSIGATKPTGSSNGAGFVRPSNGVVTSPYGYRVHPITGEHTLHGGTDFGGNGAIVAAQGGVVEVAGYDSGWGNHVTINHGNGLKTLYAHMVSGSLAVAPGQNVSQGQHLGIMGTTGSSTGVHLHFEVYVNGNRVNPASYLGL
ncbi:Septal ring factor EnvC, activator of murein hydrolases AmiA and AmiB [Carnobacterium iners]|uniref:Septal ring factor EnvC, activator of murein hydrolases AmiA and AmiB n=1 Tax=Carnobacterium iners TaxID=1073423 RepID=A0A1X7NRV7_9LACT|nr:M23 family metallopeptidase [Carnobacterium iners]SEK89309.1 Septal ring factor EnvC, activator of murein hydrolases AmiA and AmiB [Carnobacterium iners]SMH40872.1 Septal ring factor EnvC, activator of murein hydrolases AmiA and AmiB [Carnobacterium iners]